jgi:gamma-glutamyl:cysteine ligase YbdK (ATP-grasp superfamily)
LTRRNCLPTPHHLCRSDLSAALARYEEALSVRAAASGGGGAAAAVEVAACEIKVADARGALGDAAGAAAAFRAARDRLTAALAELRQDGGGRGGGSDAAAAVAAKAGRYLALIEGQLAAAGGG